MNLPFFYPEHPEFKAHVEYVRGEMLGLVMEVQQGLRPHQYVREAEDRAKEIVLWVSSKPANDWNSFKVWSFGYIIGAGVTVLLVWIVGKL